MKRMSIAAGILVVGGVFGGLGTGYVLMKSFGETIHLLSSGHLAKWERHAELAYFRESPDVAVWEMSNLLELLTGTKDKGHNDPSSIDYALFKTHARLASLHSRLDEPQKAAEHFERAIELIRKNPRFVPRKVGNVQDKSDVLQILQIIDAIAQEVNKVPGG